MYETSITVERIKSRAKENGISVKTMLEDCGLNKNTLSSMQSRGSWLQSNSLAKIADYLDCSVDYLLGRVDTSNGTYSINNHNTTVNGTQTNVINGNVSVSQNSDSLTKQFLEKFETLSFEEKIDTIQYVNKTHKK